MAIRKRRRAGDDVWQVYWNNPETGRRESKTFRTREEAEKENSLLLHRLHYEPESFRKEKKPPEPLRLTLEAVYLSYLCEKQFAKADLARHRGNMRLSLDMLGGKPVGEITPADIDEVRKVLQSRGLSPATVHGRLSILRTVMYYAARKGYRDEIKYPRIPGAQYQRFIPPSPEEVMALLDAAPPHIQRLIILGAYCGARIGQCEAFKLTWSDVDLGQQILRIHGSRKNLAAQWREVPIREELVPVFERWKTEDDKIGATHLINYHGQKINSVETAWANTLERAGISRRIRPYDLRHAFGTNLVAAGIDVGTVASLMGHSNPTMLLTHYQYVMDRQKRSAVEALPRMSHVPNHVPNEKGAYGSVRKRP